MAEAPIRLAGSNFERLKVYLLAERLADEVWSVVLKWEYFPRDTIGKQLCARGG
jgi:hypothetical protein